MKTFISATEAADLLKLAPSAIRQAIQKGTIEGGIFNGQYIAECESVKNYVPRKYGERKEGKPGGRPVSKKQSEINE